MRRSIRAFAGLLLLVAWPLFFIEEIRSIILPKHVLKELEVETRVLGQMIDKNSDSGNTVSTRRRLAVESDPPAKQQKIHTTSPSVAPTTDTGLPTPSPTLQHTTINNLHRSDTVDGCGHEYARHLNGNTDMDTRHHPRYAAPNQEDLNWLRQARQCVQRFDKRDYKFTNKFDSPRLHDLQTLQCNLPVNYTTITQTLKHYKTVWFLGDSIVSQQFYTLLCMVNPDLNVTQDMSLYINTAGTPDLPMSAKYVYTHKQSSSNTPRSSSTTTTTTFQYSRFGWKMGDQENNLYQKGMAFSKAIQTLGKDDAIVIGASAHYNSQRAPLLERALRYIRAQAQHTQASVFYMEATNEEWPTSNGIWTAGCPWKCQCQKLTNEQLQGHYDWTRDGVPAISQAPMDRLPAPDLDFVQTYRLAAQDSPIHPHYHHNSSNCYPDCLPAHWRSTVAHSILDAQQASSSCKVAMVPLFWQLALKPTPTFLQQGDCTHKNYAGIVTMNQQLIRTMLAHRQKQRY